MEISSNWHPGGVIRSKGSQDYWMFLWWTLQTFISAQVEGQAKDRILVLLREPNQLVEHC